MQASRNIGTAEILQIKTMKPQAMETDGAAVSCACAEGADIIFSNNAGNSHKDVGKKMT